MLGQTLCERSCCGEMMDDIDCDVASDVSRGGCTSVIHSDMYVTLHTSTYVKNGSQVMGLSRPCAA